MKEKRVISIRTTLLIVLTILLVSAFCVAFFPQDRTLPDDCRPVNFYEDGSCDRQSSGTPGVSTGIKAAEGDPTLLQHSEVLNVVIFICFSDETESTFLPSSLTNAVMDKFNGNSVSLFDYYRTLSYGAFTVRSVAPTKNIGYYVYKDARTRSYYERVTASSGTSRYNPESTLLNNAVAAADAYFDYQGLRLDSNDDGFVDSVSFVVSGTYSSSAWGTLMWPHAWNLNKITGLSSTKGESSTLNGLKVDNYTFTFAGDFKIGLIAHEFGHIIGLPDFYHYGSDTNANRLPVGYWDLMHLDCLEPQFMTSYTRDKYLGFLDKKQVIELTVGGTYTLSPTATSTLNDVVAYKVTLNENESIWMEYRTNAATTYDRGLPSDGLLVYRVNTSVTGNTDGKYQDSRNPDELYIYRPNNDVSSISGLKQKELAQLSFATLNTYGGDNPVSYGNSTANTKYTPGCLFLTDGTNTGIVVTVNSLDATNITFTVDLGEYDGAYIGDSYVMGTTLDGSKKVRNESYVYYGQTPDISVFVRYTSRPTAIELADYELEYENKICPEGQTAYVVFTDAYGERRLPFTLHIYDVLKVDATVVTSPAVTNIPVGGTLDLTGLSILIDYLSGKTEKVTFNDKNASDWTITEGLDTTRSGSYSHVVVRYNEKVFFTLPTITVRSSLLSLRVEEKDTLHLVGDHFTPSFHVIGSFRDGSEHDLSSNEFTVTDLTSDPTPFVRTAVTVSANEDPTITTSSYVYYTGNATATSATLSSSPVTISVNYGSEPTFTGGKISLTFDNGGTISGDYALLLENYTSVLLKNFSPTRTGTQTLFAHFGPVTVSVNVNVLPKSGSLLAISDNTIVLADEKTSRIYLLSDMTVPAFYALFSSSLDVVLQDAEEGFDLLPGAYASRYAGANLKLTLRTESGLLAGEYSVYRIGDCDGDGLVDDADKAGWVNAILNDKPYDYPYLDVSGDGKYSLTDFILLLQTEVTP